jgi:hypothetical protein
MKCNTEIKREQGNKAEKALEEIENYGMLTQDWESVNEQLGIDLETTAREAKAICRNREIRSAKDLLRMNLFYAISDLGLRLTGAWALLCGIGKLSDVAVLNRLRHSQRWLGQLVGRLLAKHCQAAENLPGVRLRLIDATCLSQPGSKGTSWRIHMSYDIGNLCIDHVEVTDQHGGESLERFPAQANEILVADCGYAFASGMSPILASGAGLVIRINWRNVKVFTPEKRRFQIIPWLKTISGASMQSVLFETPQGWFTLRLVAVPLPPQKAEMARRKVRQRYQRKQKQVSQETLFAAGFVLLLTNLPAEDWPTPLVLALYRTRWQIEIVFKRLKSLLHFDHLRAKDPHLAQSYIFSKILIALILDQKINHWSAFFPDWFTSLEHPINLSRLTSFVHESLKQSIFGPVFSGNLSLFFIALKRYFCDPKRSRPKQLILTRFFIQCISSTFSYPLS